LLKGVVLDEIAGPVAADFLVSEYAWVLSKTEVDRLVTECVWAVVL
jgi:hypothetical protein